MITRWTVALRKLRRWFSRSEWAIRLLHLSRSEETANEPGLILLQIDGLSGRQFDRAVKGGSMPFLRQLLAAKEYRRHTFYSGIPSTTPAVQAELFYGVLCAVPAFSFRDHETGNIVRMFDQEVAQKTEERLQAAGRGLLEGGSSYSNLYTGGAAEAHFCAPTIGWGDVFRDAAPASVAGLAAWHVGSFLRVLVLAVAEFGLALVDCLRGIIAGHDLRSEFKTVTSRVAVSIGLREFVAIGATIDAARGLPIIHANFLGYDEQAHRRGPGSRFAHWSLKGIDGAIRRIWNAARRSARRDYEVWIYSDHGQQRSESYRDLHGRPVEEVVAELFGAPATGTDAIGTDAIGTDAIGTDAIGTDAIDTEQRLPADRGVQSARAAWIRRRKEAQTTPTPPPENGEEKPVPAVRVAAMGPLGHIYPERQLSQPGRETLAKTLVERAGVPLALVAEPGGEAKAFTATGEYALPSLAGEVLGSDHPFLREAAQDLVRLCHHPDAGEIIFSGLSLHGPFVTFPLEKGAHGGPGPDETQGFALLPGDVLLPRREREYLRAVDLRQAALHALGRAPLPAVARPTRRRAKPETLRIMTYNVHSCVGMDGRLSPGRIARLIAQHDIDVVALQELDVGRGRTGGVDQAHAIAQRLEMMFHFHPAIRLAEEQYGDAVLSRLPMQLRRAGPLPGATKRHHERRGALWVEIEFAGSKLQLLNTHFGLSQAEQLAQAKTLLGPDWLSHPGCQNPIIACGDFNAHPRSLPYAMLHQRFPDAQRRLSGHRPRATWFSSTPFHRIDHIFVSSDVVVRSIDVPRTDLARVASDHLPLIVEVSLIPKPVAVGPSSEDSQRLSAAERHEV